jgi:hypothetical protein
MTIRRLRRLLAAALLAAAACAPENGPSMRPGSDCLACHGRPGAEEDGPPWTIAGTVYATPQGTGKGVRGAAIHVTDASGRTVTVHSQEAGNFYLADGLTFPLQVSVERNGATQTMGDPVSDGSCNRCHFAGSTAAGVEGSIAAP